MIAFPGPNFTLCPFTSEVKVVCSFPADMVFAKVFLNEEITIRLYLACVMWQNYKECFSIRTLLVARAPVATKVNTVSTF